MSLIEQQNFLARLYTDENLRRNFFQMPEKTGAENGLNANEIAELLKIAPRELNFFADSLFRKRLREAVKILPLTKRILENDFEKEFRIFSQNYNPHTVKKHLEDAFEFCKFLQKREISELAKNAAAFEKSRLAVSGFGRKFALCRLDYDIRQLFKGASVENIARKGKIAVWLKIGGKIKHFYI